MRAIWSFLAFLCQGLVFGIAKSSISNDEESKRKGGFFKMDFFYGLRQKISISFEALQNEQTCVKKDNISIQLFADILGPSKNHWYFWEDKASSMNYRFLWQQINWVFQPIYVRYSTQSKMSCYKYKYQVLYLPSLPRNSVVYPLITEAWSHLRRTILRASFCSWKSQFLSLACSRKFSGFLSIPKIQCIAHKEASLFSSQIFWNSCTKFRRTTIPSKIMANFLVHCSQSILSDECNCGNRLVHLTYLTPNCNFAGQEMHSQYLRHANHEKRPELRQ